MNLACSIPESGRVSRESPGRAELAFRRAGDQTVLASARATSPLRLLTPRNHGRGAWVYMAGLGGGLLGGDHYDVSLQVERGAAAFVTTQSATKVYGSEGGCSQRLVGRVADDACLALVPDPVVCFAGAEYRQVVELELAPRASLALLDGYTCGRSARGERWQFRSYSARTTVFRDDRAVAIDSVRLEPLDGPLADRMGAYDVYLTLLVLGEAFGTLRKAILAAPSERAPHATQGSPLVAASPLGEDGAVLRVAAGDLESGAGALRSSFEALARVLGDDPFARKW